MRIRKSNYNSDFNNTLHNYKININKKALNINKLLKRK